MRRGDQHTRAECGFSLVEIVVAMFVLALMALAVLPVAIGATKASVTNRSVIAATSFANATLEAIRAEFPQDADQTEASGTSCGDLRDMAAVDIDDPAGTGLLATIGIAPGSCPTALPGTMTVTVSVREASASVPTVVLATEVVVTSA